MNRRNRMRATCIAIIVASVAGTAKGQGPVSEFARESATLATPEVTDPQKAATLAAPVVAGGAQSEVDLPQKVDGLSKKLTVTTADEQFKMVLGGAITADFLYNQARPVAPGVPFFLAPGSVLGFDQNTFDANARQTSLYALVSGPEVCGFQSGGFILVNFFNDAIINDRYGLLPIQAYGQLKNDQWRIAAGLQIDIFNAPFPDVLPFSLLLASGNTAAYRTQLRLERFFHPADQTEVKVIAGISEPIPTTITNSFETIDLSEDNGWPNLESRVVLGLGPEVGEGLAAHRPFELGVSGVVGEIRNTRFFTRVVVASVWGLGSDLRWDITDQFGVKGELFVGQTLGTYGGGILQDVNSVTQAGVHAAGGFVQLHWNILPDCLRANIGYGIDDPLDSDLAPLQAVRNETVFANLMWDVNKQLRLAGELTYRKTAYTGVPNNDSFGFQTQFQWKF